VKVPRLGLNWFIAQKTSKENPLDFLFCFPVIRQNSASDTKDQTSVSVKQNGESIIAALAQRIH